MIKYCTQCLYPETKPDLHIDAEGVCSACRSYEKRTKINWEDRALDLERILEKYRNRDGSNYDCIVPVSGGKDSTYQVLKVLEFGLNPLCVTGTTCSLSEIGRRNIENLKNLGVDYIEVTTNPIVRRKMNRLCLRTIGDISWPEHVKIFTIPVQVAVKYNVKLIIWGENPQHEYGGPAASQQSNVLDRNWLEEFGGLLGFRVTDFIDQEGIEKRHLIPFTYPSDKELQAVGVTGLFLGYYVPWDGYTNALYAQAYGFETYPNVVEGSLADYENLDNHHMGIHDYFKYLKFGFGRASDIASNHIRRGRLRRADALNLIKRHDGKFPWTYLGKPVEDILSEISVPFDEFIKICDQFTNKRLFECDHDNVLIKDKNLNLTKTNDDNL